MEGFFVRKKQQLFEKLSELTPNQAAKIKIFETA